MRLPRLAALALIASTSGCLAYHAGALPGEPEDARYVELDGVRVRYAEAGPADGPAVVLVHGFASSLETWAPVMPALAEAGMHAIALDLKGFGWTERPAGDYSTVAQARLVLGLLDHLHVRDAAFVGHSYGGGVVLRIALMAPERVRRIALYDAWAYDDQLPPFFHVSRADGIGEAAFALWYGERAEDRMAMAFYDQRFVTMELVDAVDAALRRPGTYAAALAAVRAMHYEEVQDRYREVTVPALLLWGREDRVTPIHVGERLARDLPGSHLVVYPGCGHFPMIEHAAQSTAELVRFVGEDAGSITSGAEIAAPEVTSPAAPSVETPPAAWWNGGAEPTEPTP